MVCAKLVQEGSYRYISLTSVVMFGGILVVFFISIYSGEQNYEVAMAREASLSHHESLLQIPGCQTLQLPRGVQLDRPGILMCMTPRGELYNILD